jgi:hypothetical protein
MQEGCGCDWEHFRRQSLWFDHINISRAPGVKERLIEERKNKIRDKFGVPMPSEEVYCEIHRELVRTMGPPPGRWYKRSQILDYWRRHRSRYPAPLPVREHDEEWLRGEMMWGDRDFE